MTQSLEDYLETVYVLIKNGSSAGVRAVADTIGVKMPSVVKAVHELKKMELVTQEPYQSIKLTEKGVRVAKLVLNRHNLIKNFLISLGVSKKTADKDACLMEHILSAETLDKIKAYTENKKKKKNEKPN
jgi:DtxR family Mn-dependent transcriptional regulator